VSDHITAHLVLADALDGTIGILGLLAASTWIAWRFGATLLRVAGFCSLWVAWACGSEGGYGYCVGFVVLGMIAWGAGTAWYAKRRGRWPSALSERLLTGLLGKRSPLGLAVPPAVPTAPRRHR
jgi:hypothetical protein